ncbi:MAG: hypothetical protein ACI4M6_00620, partial [Christensenellaceae bacterium]
TLNNVGTTEITLPEDYTDNTVGPEDSIAGKSFVFNGISCPDDAGDASLLEMMVTANCGAIWTFGTDGTCAYKMPAQNTVQKFTYEQNGETIACEFVEMLIDGKVVDIGEQAPIQISFTNVNRIVMEQTIENVVYSYIYDLTSAE